MNFLLNYGFNENEIQSFSKNIPPLLYEQLLNSYKLVSQNIESLNHLGILNTKEVFFKFYDMFLMDNSNFMNIFNKYEIQDLIEKINNNVEIIEFL